MPKNKNIIYITVIFLFANSLASFSSVYLILYSIVLKYPDDFFWHVITAYLINYAFFSVVGFFILLWLNSKLWQ